MHKRTYTISSEHIDQPFQPCPFCGGTELDLTQVDIEQPDGLPVAIHCDDCAALGPYVYAPADADSDMQVLAAMWAWNKRR